MSTRAGHEEPGLPTEPAVPAVPPGSALPPVPPVPPVSGLPDGTVPADVPALVARLGEEDLGRADRARLLGRLAAQLARGARVAGLGAVTGGRWLADVVVDVAPHLPFRDLPTLQLHYPGLQTEDLAGALITTASRSTAAVGAAGGAVSAAEYAAPPLLLSTPVTVAAETLVVVTVEVKLVAELHAVYGAALPPGQAARASAFVRAWADRRGIDVTGQGAGGVGGVGPVLGTASRRELSKRIARRFGRNLTTLTPFLAGALAGAELNRRETRSLGEKVAADLRRRSLRS